MISIIVPIYNVSKYLKRCLDSIIDQTYKDLEIILVNDGSTDNSGDICEDYAKKDYRIRVIHKENGGVSSARNVGLDVAKGEYIGFVDGDDVLDPKMYEVLILNAQKYDCDISCCQIATKNIDGSVNKLYDNESSLLNTEHLIENYFFDSFVKDTMYSQCNKIFKKSSLADLRYENYSYCEDILFIFEVLIRSQKIYYDRFVGYYYIHRNTSAMTSSFSRKRLDYISAARDIERICKSKYDLAYSNARRWVYIHVLNTLREIYASGKLKELKEFYEKEKKYLKGSKKEMNGLSFKNKFDYFMLMHFPIYFKIVSKLKRYI